VRTRRLAAGRGRQPACRAAHAIKLARSPAPAGRQVRLCPSKAERCLGDVGAPTGAGHY